MNEETRSKLFLFTSLGIIFLYLSPLYFLQKNSHVLIHDYLDGTHTHVTLLAKSDKLFCGLDETLPFMMNDLPRASYGSDLNFEILLYRLMDPFWAHVFNITLIHAIAFIGMFLFLRKHFGLYEPKSLINEYLITATSLCFALLPFWPGGGLSIAGIPLVLHSFLNFKNHNSKIIDWIILVVLPFYSSLVLSGLFVIIVVGAIFLIDSYRNKRFNRLFLASQLIFVFLYVFVEYRLIASVISSSLISHRSDFFEKGISFVPSIKESFTLFFKGQYHAHSLQFPIMIICFLLAFFVRKTKAEKKSLYCTAGFVFIISWFYGFIRWEVISELRESIWFLRVFQIDRFYVFFPFLWTLLLTISLFILSKYRQKRKLIFSAVLIIPVMQIVFMFYSSEEIQGRKKGLPSYSGFYQVELFNDIKDQLDYSNDTDKVGCIGFHPSVAQYSGFWTLGGYSPNYPLEYKKEFRKIIEKELDRNEVLKNYYDYWGNRCYLFSSELGRPQDILHKLSNEDLSINELNINSMVFKNLGGRYLFSVAKINVFTEGKFRLVKMFSDHENNRIWVYEVM